MDSRFATTLRIVVYTLGTSCAHQGLQYSSHLLLGGLNSPTGAPCPLAPQRLPQGQGSALCFCSNPTWTSQGLLCQEFTL